MARGSASMHVQTYARVRVQLRAYALACGFQMRSRAVFKGARETVRRGVRSYTCVCGGAHPLGTA